jgi:glyoxylase-like metal-dependent hydrolase (beta-lactamase superfamily II)
VTCDRLYCLVLGHEWIPKEYIVAGGGDELLRLPFTSVLAHSAEGWFLFDTGTSPEVATTPEIFERWWQWGPPELPPGEDPLLEALSRCGVQPDEIAGVALSHMHVDHVGGLRHFAGETPIYVQRAEYEVAMSETAAAWGYYPEEYVDADLNWQLLDGDTGLASGIEAVDAAGHAPGQMSFKIDLATTGTWVFAFDAIPTQENVDLDSPINVGSTDDPDGRRRAHDRLIALAHDGGRLVPGHCPVTWPTLRQPPEYYE